MRGIVGAATGLWLVAVVAAGLAAALVAGWPLGLPVLGSVLLCTWLPMVGWALVAERTMGWLAVGALLVVANASVILVVPGGPGDRTVPVVLLRISVYAAGEVAVVAAAYLAWRSLSRPVAVRAAIAAMGLVVVTACAGGVASTVGDPPVPANAEVLPLPQPLRLESSRNEGCDGGATAKICRRTLIITGPEPMTNADLVDVLWSHLESVKGWDGVDRDEPCRQIAWPHLFGGDQAIMCVGLEASTADSPLSNLATATLSLEIAGP